MRIDRTGTATAMIAGAALLALLLVSPALVMGDALSGDAPVHVRWQAQFGAAFAEGSLYPRWLASANQGFGSPAFFFYPPLVQWAGALFTFVAPGPGAAMIRLILGVWLLSVAGAAGCWLWLREVGLRAPAATLGAWLFVLMPYRAFVDVYQRGAVAELVGICAMPWLFHGAVRAARGDARGWGILALSTGAILYSHLPSALIGIVAAAGYVVWLAGGRDMRAILHGGSAMLTGAAIGGLSIVPALGLLDRLTDTTAMFGARNQPVNWLLFGTPWIDQSVHLMTAALTAMAIAVGGTAAALCIRRTPAGQRTHILFLVAVILAVAILNTVIARPFWALQTPLSRIQFPFRLLSLDVIALAGLIGLAFDAWEPRLRRPTAMAVVTVLLGGFLLLNAAMLTYQTWRNRDDRPMTAAQILATNVDTSEYVPGDLPTLAARFGAANTIAVTGHADALRQPSHGRTLTFDVTATLPSSLALRQFAFTGWACRIDGGEWMPASEAALPSRVPVCTVPAGRHRLDARLTAPPAEQAGLIATVIGFAVALCALLAGRVSTRPASTQAAGVSSDTPGRFS